MCLTRMRPYRVLLSFVCGLCAVLALYWVAPAPRYPISGFLLPIKPSKQMVPADQVQLFSLNQLPESAYSLRGHISLVWHSPEQSADKERALIEKAKQEASASGANAIVLSVLGHTANNVSKQWSSYRLEGRAVSVPQLELLRSEGGSL